MLTKEVLADKNATTLKQAVLNTAGVTLGTGEGGNAFGDRFFIRGFDARNDVFIDGMRDAGVSVRENFFTEQVEILRGPGSSFAGRGTTGGAINIVTKQATTEKSFYNMDTTFGTDHTKRVMLDVNQVISPTLAVRAGGLFQDAGVAGRNYIKDDRDGGFVAAKWTPLDAVKLTRTTSTPICTACRISACRTIGPARPAPQFTDTAGGPFPDFGVNRNNFYGFVNRDYYSIKQDIGTINAEVTITPDLTLSNKTRVQRSVHDYIGTLPEAPVTTNPLRYGRSAPIRRAAIRSPRTSPTRPRRPTSSTSAAGRTRRWRRRSFARDRQHRQIYRPQFGSAAGRHSPARIVDRRQHLRSAIHVCDRSAATRAGPACRPRSRSTPRAAM